MKTNDFGNKLDRACMLGFWFIVILILGFFGGRLAANSFSENLLHHNHLLKEENWELRGQLESYKKVAWQPWEVQL